MTSNEKKVLVKFKEVKQGNTVTMAGTLRSTINYAYEICKKLCEKGYLEKLSLGRFALYRITPLGEEQVRGEGEGEREAGVGVGAEEEVKKEIEETEEYECTNCGAVVKESDTECPKCGTILEGYEEEPEEEMVEQESSLHSGSPSSEESLAPAQDKLHEEPPQPTPQNPEKRNEETSQPTQQNPEGNEASTAKESNNVDEKTEILDHPSVPKDWKTCNWKWK